MRLTRAAAARLQVACASTSPRLAHPGRSGEAVAIRDPTRPVRTAGPVGSPRSPGCVPPMAVRSGMRPGDVCRAVREAHGQVSPPAMRIGPAGDRRALAVAA